MSNLIQLPGTKAAVPELNREHLVNCLEKLKEGVENGSIHSIIAVTITDAGAGLFTGNDGSNDNLQAIGAVQAALHHLLGNGVR